MQEKRAYGKKSIEFQYKVDGPFWLAFLALFLTPSHVRYGIARYLNI